MFIISVDTPWVTDLDGAPVGQLVLDSRFTLHGWSDITGKDGVFIDQVNRTLYGGNYHIDSGIQPGYLGSPSNPPPGGYDLGRLGGSGNPNWLTLSATVADQATIDAIQADDEYEVWWQEEITEGAVAASSTSGGPGELPDAAAFGQMRAKLARRGYADAWIDKFLGTEPGGRTRLEIDQDVRYGYVHGQVPPPGATVVDIDTLTNHLADEGWSVSNDDMILVVNTQQGDRWIITWQELVTCNYDGMPWSPPLKRDICQWMVGNNYCEVCE